MLPKNEKNLHLTQQQFKLLLRRLKKGDEFLFEKIFIHLFERNVNLIKRKYQAQHEDAYDCVMWATMKMREMLLEDKIKYGNINSYFTRIALTRFLKTQSRKREVSTASIVTFHLQEAKEFDD